MNTEDAKQAKQLCELNIQLQLKVRSLELENENLICQLREVETEREDFHALKEDLAEMRQHLLKANSALIQKREEVHTLRRELDAVTKESGQKIRLLEVNNKHLSRLASRYSSSTESIFNEGDSLELSLSSNGSGSTKCGGSASNIPVLISTSNNNNTNNFGGGFGPNSRYARVERTAQREKCTPLAPHK